MIGRATRVLLRHYLEQGVSKAAIARELGISRRTVYRWIASGQLDWELDDGAVQYGPRARRVSKLDPYKGVIDARLAEYPGLSAVRLFEEVRSAGYAGGYDSRHRWLQYYERQTMAVVMRGLEAAFRYFRGVPAEILFDQMKEVVVEDGCADGGRLVENPEFLRFANHWGFRVRAWRPYRAQTKGKVERPVRYLRDNFFYGRDFVSDDDLNARALHWLDTVANIRIHGTLKERPAEHFEAERPHLLPLAPWPYRQVAPQRVDRAGELAGGRVPIRLVDVERRPLAEYARLRGGAS